jgi:hypothetical protein
MRGIEGSGGRIATSTTGGKSTVICRRGPAHLGAPVARFPRKIVGRGSF